MTVKNTIEPSRWGRCVRFENYNKRNHQITGSGRISQKINKQTTNNNKNAAVRKVLNKYV